MDWESEFDKLFSDISDGFVIKVFIRSQRSQLLKSLVEEVEKLDGEKLPDGYSSSVSSSVTNYGSPSVKNPILQDVIKLLEKYKEKL